MGFPRVPPFPKTIRGTFKEKKKEKRRQTIFFILIKVRKKIFKSPRVPFFYHASLISLDSKNPYQFKATKHFLGGLGKRFWGNGKTIKNSLGHLFSFFFFFCPNEKKFPFPRKIESFGNFEGPPNHLQRKFQQFFFWGEKPWVFFNKISFFFRD